MEASAVNELNAYKFNDSFAIVVTESGEVRGLEHNETEAKKIAAYLTGYHGKRFSVFANSKDVVRAAKAIRKDVMRVKDREYILQEMGV